MIGVGMNAGIAGLKQERDEVEVAYEAHRAEARRLRRVTPTDQLVWAEYTRGRLEGRWAAYGAATLHAVAEVKPDGRWRWFDHADEVEASGKAGSLEEARAEIEQRWATAVRPPEPLSEQEAVAAYRRSLVERVGSSASSEACRALAAVQDLDRLGWLGDCPVIDQEWVGYFPETLLIRLAELGKLPEFPDRF